MKILSELMLGLILALVLLAGLGALVSGFGDPDRRGTLAIAGAVLVGSTMITLAILNRPGDDA